MGLGSMPKRGQVITYQPREGRPIDRAAYLAMYAYRDGCPYADGVEQAVRNQKATKIAARAISGADQRARTEAKAIAAREKRDQIGSAPLKAKGQMLLPID
jgi:hypothetical protein